MNRDQAQYLRPGKRKRIGSRPEQSMSAEQRFFRRVEFTDHWYNGTRCLDWVGGLCLAGYGRLYVKRVGILTHRWLYERWVGAIPENLTIDHLCRRRTCCNPMHLEAVPLEENKARGQSLPAKNARKTHCDSGHEFTADNTFITKEGYRRCRKCRRRIGMAGYYRRTRGEQWEQVIETAQAKSEATTKTQAQYLQSGDYLPATKATVVGVVHSSLSLSSDKVEVTLETSRGIRKAQWSKQTMIGFVRG